MSDDKENTDPTLEEIYGRFYYCLYGCNQRVRELLDNYLRFSSAYFYEYLAHVPVPYVGDNDEAKVREAMKGIYLLSPFARRMIEESPIVPDVPEDGKPIRMAFRTRLLQRQQMMRFAMGCSLVAKALYRQWNGLGPRHFSCPGLSIHTWDSCQSAFTKGMKPNRFSYGIIRGFQPAMMTASYASAQTEAGSSKSLGTLQVLLNIIFPGEVGRRGISGLLLPIASDRYFYGCIWMLLPGLEHLEETGGPGNGERHAASQCGGLSAEAREDTKCNQLSICENERDRLLGQSPDETSAPTPHLMAKLLGVVHDHYLPVLALQHEQLCETFLHVSETEKAIQPTGGSGLDLKLRRVFASIPERKGHGISHTIEDRLVDLEGKRSATRQQLNRMRNKQRKAPILEALHKLDVFQKYTVCSQAMVKLLIEVVSAAKPLSASGSSLHALLIVGGPGTGKESLANILAAFSESYLFGKRYTVNMAALKPGPVVPIAISGMKIEGAFRQQRIEIALDGILASVRKARISDLGYSDRLANANSVTISKWLCDLQHRKDFPMLVLDELNSMDPDSQGVLLRFLENAEVVPIGGTVDPLDVNPSTSGESRQRKDLRVKLSHFLVVGMMNEDPEAISREEAMEFVTESKYLRGIVSDMLYEHVLKLRRLRPDIKYRMVRAGKLVIPLLRDRREDIPCLFYLYLNSQTNEKNIKFQITLAALAQLVSGSLRWPGNIRQLQALAAKVAVIACDEPAAAEGNTYWVDKQHVERGMAEIGMTVKNENQE